MERNPSTFHRTIKKIIIFPLIFNLYNSVLKTFIRLFFRKITWYTLSSGTTWVPWVSFAQHQLSGSPALPVAGFGMRSCPLVGRASELWGGFWEKSQIRFIKMKRQKVSVRLPQQAGHSDSKFGCLLTHSPSRQGTSLMDVPPYMAPLVWALWCQRHDLKTLSATNTSGLYFYTWSIPDFLKLAC